MGSKPGDGLNNPSKPTEWTNLFEGTTSPQPLQYGRYGTAGGQPLSTTGQPARWNWNQQTGQETPPPFYSKIDFDATDDTTKSNLGGPSQPYTLPSQNSPLPFSCFPTYSAGYENAAPVEMGNHPSLYDFFQPTFPSNRSFGISEMEALLRYGDTGSLALKSDLFRLLPQNLSQNPRAHQLLTTHSFDLDRPGVRPWVWPDPKNPQYSYNLSALGQGTSYPTGNPIPSPTSGAPGGEFAPDGRAADAL